MKRRASAFLRWVVILAIIGGAGAIGSQVVYSLVRPKVTVTHPVEAPVVQAFYATGTLMAEREYEIKSNAPGYVSEVLVEKGDRVKKDQPLAMLIEDGVQQKFDQARAERDEKAKFADEKNSPVLQEFVARISAYTDILNLARIEQKRLTDLIEKNAASQVDGSGHRANQNVLCPGRAAEGAEGNQTDRVAEGPPGGRVSDEKRPV